MPQNSTPQVAHACDGPPSEQRTLLSPQCGTLLGQRYGLRPGPGGCCAGCGGCCCCCCTGPCCSTCCCCCCLPSNRCSSALGSTHCAVGALYIAGKLARKALGVLWLAPLSWRAAQCILSVLAAPALLLWRPPSFPDRKCDTGALAASAALWVWPGKHRHHITLSTTPAVTSAHHTIRVPQLGALKLPPPASVCTSRCAGSSAGSCSTSGAVPAGAPAAAAAAAAGTPAPTLRRITCSPRSAAMVEVAPAVELAAAARPPPGRWSSWAPASCAASSAAVRSYSNDPSRASMALAALARSLFWPVRAVLEVPRLTMALARQNHPSPSPSTCAGRRGLVAVSESLQSPLCKRSAALQPPSSAAQQKVCAALQSKLFERGAARRSAAK